MDFPDSEILPESLLKDEDALQVVQANIFGFVDRCIREVMTEWKDVKITRVILGRNLVAALIPDNLDDLAKWNNNPVKQVGTYPNGTELFVSRKDDFVNLFYKTDEGKTSREFSVPSEVMDLEEEDVIVESLLKEDE